MIRNFLLLFLVLCFFSCRPKVEKRFLAQLELTPQEYDDTGETRLPNTGKVVSSCKDKQHHIPDPERLEFTPLKILKVNFHIMRDGNGGGNFPNKEHGRAFVKAMLANANQKLTQNKKMFLPLNNETPVIPMCYQFELTPRPDDPMDDGIYFHDDDDIFYMTNYGKKKNIYKRNVYDKYGIQKDTVMNVFVMGFHQDSIASPTYRLVSNGVAFGRWVKLASWYYFMGNKDWKLGDEIAFKDSWTSQRLLNHEIGHCLGLRHSWVGNDGCDDTPKHPNCWNYTKDGSKCDSIISNNIMDYTAHASAWSPCQIGTVHYNFSRKSYRVRKLLKKTWCTFDDSKTIHIKTGENVVWPGAKDLEGNIVVEDGASLTIQCRVSLPPQGKIIVKPQGKLLLSGATLENDCGETWEGIEVWKSKGLEGEVVLVNDAKIEDAKNAIELKIDQSEKGD